MSRKCRASSAMLFRAERTSEIALGWRQRIWLVSNSSVQRVPFRTFFLKVIPRPKMLLASNKVLTWQRGRPTWLVRPGLGKLNCKQAQSSSKLIRLARQPFTISSSSSELIPSRLHSFWLTLLKERVHSRVQPRPQPSLLASSRKAVQWKIAQASRQADRALIQMQELMASVQVHPELWDMCLLPTCLLGTS